MVCLFKELFTLLFLNQFFGLQDKWNEPGRNNVDIYQPEINLKLNLKVFPSGVTFFLSISR